MMNKIIYDKTKNCFFDFDKNNIKAQGNVIIGDNVVSKESCLPYTEDIVKFLIHVLYMSNSKSTIEDLNYLLEYIENDPEVKSLTKNFIKIVI